MTSSSSRTCCETIGHSYLAIVNFITLACGLIVMCGGIYLLCSRYGASEEIRVIAWFLTAFGSAVSIISFLGCCGVCVSSKTMLNVYAIILFLLVIGQAALVIYAIKSTDTASVARSIWFANHEGVDMFRNHFEQTHECCGYDTIFDGIVKGRGLDADIKYHCFFKRTCKEPFHAYIERAFLIGCIVLLSITGLELINMIVAGLLAGRLDQVVRCNKDAVLLSRTRQVDRHQGV